MRWSVVRPGLGQGFLTCLEAAASLDGFDPQLIWADVTTLRASDAPTEQLLPVSFEARVDGQGHLLLPDPSLVVLNATTLALGRACASRIFTGFMKAGRVADLAGQVTRFRVGMLPRPGPARDGTMERRAQSVSGTATEPSQRGDGVVIGIIDHGIPFANRQFAFRRAGLWHSRIERLWDQQFGIPGARPAPDPREDATLWQAPNGFCYGRELVNLAPGRSDGPARAVIDLLMNSGTGEADIYRLAAYRPVQAARAHGAHVLGLAAGHTRYSGELPAQEPVDPASRARIIAVQLPNLPEKDTSGQSLHVHLLDAVSYIMHHAGGRKVAINLSDGSYAGPHDGQSMLERALSALLPRQARDRVLAVACGNQFDERVHWADTVPRNASRTLDWRLLPEDKTDSHVQIWFEQGLAAPALRGLQVRLTPPGAPASLPVRIGQTAVWHEDGLDGPVRACVTFARHAPNAPGGRCMVNISVACTLAPRAQAPLARAHHGVWQITLTNHGAQDVAFNATIERDNPALGDRGPRRQSHFIHPAYPRDNRMPSPALDDQDNPSPIRRMGALNIVASAAHVLVAGGHVAATRRLARYSASGPGRGGAVAGVDLLAPSDIGEARHGVRSTGVRSGTTFRMDGTSVAAPALTRALANLMAQKPDIPDLQAALKSLALRDVAGPQARVGAGRLP